MDVNSFKNGQVYENVYLVFIDAAGHSNIVRSNPRDLAKEAFDLLYSKIESRLQNVKNEYRCNIAFVWSWLGDGGMVAIHDNEERRALKTTIDFCNQLLTIDLPALSSEIKHKEMNGQIHLRIAAHKGTLQYQGDNQRGLIHSSDINWGAHLEKVTPKDSLAISKEIFDILHRKRDMFTNVGTFENREIYIYNPSLAPKIIKLQWYAAQGVGGSELIQAYPQRLSQKSKADLIGLANNLVIDFGTTLNTCSNYLFSTERPLPYKDAVCDLLSRGGHFYCYMVAANSSGASQLQEVRGEQTNEIISRSLERFISFKSTITQNRESFNVFAYPDNPNFAALIIDPDSENSLCLYSPYLNPVPGNSPDVLGRADMPHYLVKKGSLLYELIWKYVSSFIKTAEKKV